MSSSKQCSLPQPGRKRMQMWTFEETDDASGRQMPIVDGKYHDPETWEVRTIASRQECVAGPPNIDQYWHNLVAGPDDKFYAMRSSFTKDITEFMIRLGEFLKKGQCKLHSVNATEYSVTVIIESLRKRHEITAEMESCGLVGPMS
ncbi:hypothetical protein CDEST_06242 [Colletotrichum destructivum]|uniref:Uncharacterized protein n=1 Tax=Colletotrichum destructivum TaxID=34406 RepID=A0AAX4ICW1_9PEZI|nr:hypothetical protein CDEST_06242 [Colletotrichum destructivum]